MKPTEAPALESVIDLLAPAATTISPTAVLLMSPEGHSGPGLYIGHKNCTTTTFVAPSVVGALVTLLGSRVRANRDAYSSIRQARDTARDETRVAAQERDALKERADDLAASLRRLGEQLTDCEARLKGSTVANLDLHDQLAAANKARDVKAQEAANLLEMHDRQRDALNDAERELSAVKAELARKSRALHVVSDVLRRAFKLLHRSGHWRWADRQKRIRIELPSLPHMSSTRMVTVEKLATGYQP